MVRTVKPMGVSVCVGVLLVLIAPGCRPFLKSCYRDKSGVLPGLRAPVKVVRDRSGIPHIYAENRLDLMRALGYVQAQDRFLQIEGLRRTAEGRMAEAFGEQYADMDLVFRLFDAGSFAQATLASYPVEVREELEAFTEGLNARVNELQRHPTLFLRFSGLKPTPFVPADVVASSLPIALLLSCNLNEEILYLNLAKRGIAPDLIAELLPVYPGLPLQPPPLATTAAVAESRLAFDLLPGLGRLTTGVAASNNWVVDGSRSQSGKPLLANDPHLPQLIPSIWYEAVLNTPEFHVAGAMIAGLPGVVIGTNGHVAWGVTNVQADLMDLVIEKLSPDGRRYLYQDQWYPIEERPLGGQGEKSPARFTRHGPIVGDTLGKVREDSIPQVAFRGDQWGKQYALALRFSGLVPGGFVRTVLEAMRARTGRELVDAYRSFTGGAQNLVWADQEGNIGWHVVGAIPRRTGFNGKYPMPGWTGEYEWQGMIPFDELPTSENPTSHMIVTANDRTAEVPYNGNWMPPFRKDRITQLLGQRDRLTTDDFERIQNDRVSLFARRVREVLLDAGDGGDSDLTWALSELRAWDGSMEGSSRAAAICAEVQVALPRLVLAARVGSDYDDGLLRMIDFEAYNAAEDVFVRPESPLWPNDEEKRRETVRQALKEAVARLSEKLGQDRSQWRWERLNTVTFNNLAAKGSDVGSSVLRFFLDRGPYPAAGGRHTINNGWFNLRDPFKTVQISSYRFVVDMAKPDSAYAMNHTGESERWGSYHYDDMVEPWRAGRYHLLQFDEEAIRRDAESAITLSPGHAVE
jgi:penicillin amidase